MPSWPIDFKDKKRLENKASKMSQGTHLTYCWLRADNAETNIKQLQKSHELTPVVLDKHNDALEATINKALYFIETIKNLIKEKDQYLKDQANKK